MAVRPLVVGAGGLIGRNLAEHLEQRFPETVSATRAEIDITDRWGLEGEIERLRPTVVINCAGMADLDAAEKDPERALLINAEGPRNLAQACRNSGTRLIHLSTDYVFDGTKGAEYSESDPPSPINQYGYSKLLGELAVLESAVDVVVVRVSFVFGPGRITFLDRVVERAKKEKGSVPALNGWVNKPTWTGDIAAGIEKLLSSSFTGVLHLANGPAVTRLEFTRQVLALIGGDPARAVALDEKTLQLAARRPAATPLATRLFAREFGALPPWTERAREYLSNIGKGRAT